MSEYRCIYADPPWMERGGGKIKRGADRHYPLMHTRDICALAPSVEALRHPDGCALWMWATNNHLPDAFEVMAAWGVHYLTALTWIKPTIGLGQYARGMTEHLLFARWGKAQFVTSDHPLPDDLPIYLSRRKDGRHQTRTAIAATKGRHSEKPDEFREIVEWMSHGPRLEMFARHQALGWDVHGDEVKGVALPNTHGE